MATASRTITSTAPGSGLPPAFEWAADAAAVLLLAQRLQLDSLIAWQQSLTAVQQELWDEWVCRWAGGVPIDA